MVQLEQRLDRIRQYGGHDVVIDGPVEFVLSVLSVLDELRSNGPRHYREALRFLPRVEFNPQTLCRRHGPHCAAADTSGVFGAHAWMSQYGYEGFRHVYLHEVGHHVYGNARGDWSEAAAETYVRQVLAALQH